MLLIADISSHNPITNWGAFLGSVDGVICKVTEGVGYVWSGAANALAQTRAAGKCAGAYHFASAGNPVAEANYFLAHYTHRPGEVIVLDWEPANFTGDADAWAYAWCQRVIAATGVVPMLYLNHYYASVQSKWTRTRSLGCALWAAWYGANTGQPLSGRPSFAPWPDPAMWQYTSNGSRPGTSQVVDLNQFFGGADQWRAYGTSGSSPGGFLMALSDADQQNVLNWLSDLHTWVRGGDKDLDNIALIYWMLKGSQHASDPLGTDRISDLGQQVGQVQAPTVDPSVVTAAVISWLNTNKDTVVPALGASIASHLQLGSK